MDVWSEIYNFTWTKYAVPISWCGRWCSMYYITYSFIIDTCFCSTLPVVSLLPGAEHHHPKHHSTFVPHVFAIFTPVGGLWA